MRHWKIELFFWILSIALTGSLQAQQFGTPVAGTRGDFDKPNQHKLFYFDATWWLAARSSDGPWYLFRFDGANWQTQLLLGNSGSFRPDCYVDPAQNRLFTLLSHTSHTEFLRATYKNGTWELDQGFPVTLDDFVHSGDDVISLAVDHAGVIWLFRIVNATIETVYSTDGGVTWSQKLVLKSGLNVPGGLTATVNFQINGEMHLGVAYAENAHSGSTSIFGFLWHKDGDDPAAWVDETPAMPQFQGTKADDHVAAAANDEGTVYIVTKTSGGSGDIAKNGLFLRDASGWQSFIVNADSGWTRPAIALDNTFRTLYVFGVREHDPKIGVYKKVAQGKEADLRMAPVVTVFQNGEERFEEPNVSRQIVDQNMGLMVAAENRDTKTIWFNLISIQPPTAVSSPQTPPLAFEFQAPYPNPMQHAALQAGSGVNFRLRLAQPAPVTVKIYSLLGRQIAELVPPQMLPPGVYSFRWDGRAGNGRPVTPGLYFVRAQMATRIATQKVVIVR